MAKRPEPAGLALRLLASKRLREVLGGEAFQPLGAGELADGRDRALANRLVTTALRRHGQIDTILAELLEKGLPPRSGSFESVLRLSLAQLVFLPDLGAHSALFLAVEAIKRDAKARHLAGLMNAVLRRAQANSARYGLLPDDLALPQDARLRWTGIYGESALADFAAALLEGAPLDLTLKTRDDDLIAALDATPVLGQTVRIDSRDRAVDALPGFAEGAWWVQDAAAAIPATLFDLAPGRSVLDLCAAPGGKTAQLLAAGYRVTALDRDPERLARLEANMQRLGFAPEVICADAAAAPQGPYDGILLDAPCSATGTFRRHPEVLWHRSAGDIAGRVRLQRDLLAQAARRLVPGGTLIYCVCSLEPEEGEGQLDWIAKNLPDLSLAPVLASELPALPEAVRAPGIVRTHPGQKPGSSDSGLDGFFVARFKRTR